MAVGVVTRHAGRQPYDALEPQSGSQQRLDVLPGAAAVAVGIEKALLGDQTEAGAVDVDGAPLQHDSRRERRQSEPFVDPRRHGVVRHVLRVLHPPGVEPPVDESQRPGRVLTGDEGRPVVPDPHVDGGDVVEHDAARVDSAAPETRRHLGLEGSVVDQQIDRLAARQRPDHLHPGPPHPFEVIRPGIDVVRPREPRGGMGLPLRGHPVTRPARVRQSGARGFPTFSRNVCPATAHGVIRARHAPQLDGSSTTWLVRAP